MPPARQLVVAYWVLLDRRSLRRRCLPVVAEEAAQQLPGRYNPRLVSEAELLQL